VFVHRIDQEVDDEEGLPADLNRTMPQRIEKSEELKTASDINPQTYKLTHTPITVQGFCCVRIFQENFNLGRQPVMCSSYKRS